MPDISPAVEQVVLKAIAKDPAQRFTTVKEFANALEAALEQAYQEAAITPKATVLTSQPPAPVQVDTQPGPPPLPGGAGVLPGRSSPPVQPKIVLGAGQTAAQSAPFAPTQLDPRPAVVHTSTPPAQVSPSIHTEVDVQKPGLKEPALAPTVRDEAPLTGHGRVPTWRRAALLVGLVFVLAVIAVLVYPVLTGLLGTHPTTMTPPPYAPMFGFNLQHTRFNPGENKLTTTNVSKLMQDWKAPTGAGIDSSPAVANGVVYVGSDDHSLHAFKVDTGASLWGQNAGGTGGQIRSSPTVVNRVVYVGSDDDKLYAFDATNGRLLWFASTENSIRTSPTVANGKVYIGSNNHKLYAFNASGCGSHSHFANGRQWEGLHWLK